jgi:NitT/TauT family transport system substrate-binding protein
MNEVIEDHTKHFDIKIVMPIDYSAGADAIVARTSVARLADLKGQTIPLDTTGYSELLLVYALNQAGLTLHDVKTVQMDASVVPAALIGKHAEVGVTWAPHIGELTAKPGFHVLYSSADAAGLITDNFSTTEKFLKAHPGAMPAIIKGYLKGRAFIADHPDEAFQLIGKRLGITPQDAADQYKLVNSPSVPEMLAMMTGTGDSKVLPYARNIELVHSVMVEQGALKPDQTVPASAMLDPQFVQAVSEGK